MDRQQILSSDELRASVGKDLPLVICQSMIAGERIRFWEGNTILRIKRIAYKGKGADIVGS